MILALLLQIGDVGCRVEDSTVVVYARTPLPDGARLRVFLRRRQDVYREDEKRIEPRLLEGGRGGLGVVKDGRVERAFAGTAAGWYEASVEYSRALQPRSIESFEDGSASVVVQVGGPGESFQRLQSDARAVLRAIEELAALDGDEERLKQWYRRAHAAAKETVCPMAFQQLTHGARNRLVMHAHGGEDAQPWDADLGQVTERARALLDREVALWLVKPMRAMVGELRGLIDERSRGVPAAVQRQRRTLDGLEEMVGKLKEPHRFGQIAEFERGMAEAFEAHRALLDIPVDEPERMVEAAEALAKRYEALEKGVRQLP